MEKIKNFLVVLLSITMCLLCFATLIVISGGELKQAGIFADEIEYEQTEKQSTVYKNMATPYRISVIHNENVYTEQGVSGTSQFFKDCEKLLLEAVGSMSGLEECTYEQYSQALKSKSIVFSLNGRLPLYLMQMWSGGADSYENQTSTVALVRETKGVKVYFIDDGDGKCYRSQTSSANAVMDELINNYSGSNGIISVNGILSAEGMDVPVYEMKKEAVSLEESRMESLLRAFGLNPYFAKTYQEPGGDKVYIEEDNVLSVSPEGNMTYRASEDGMILGEHENITEHESVALAADRLAEISSILYADKPVVSTDIVSVQKQDNEIHIGGIIKLGGIPVSEDVCSAGIIVKDGSIVRMWIDMVNIIETDMTSVMSDVMASGLHNREDGRYEIIYISENEKLIPVNSFVR